MHSLTYKLAGIFLAIALIPLIIGINGTLSLKTAETALNENNRALQRLTSALASADASLLENVALQASAKRATEQIASAQEATAGSLRDMGGSMLPRTFAIAQIRSSLSEAAAAERALLLALNMRHLVGENLDALRAAQHENISRAREAIQGARQDYRLLMRPEEDESAWRDFEASIDAWWANHAEFMQYIAQLDDMAADLIRGGPLFTSASGKAYDTLFVTGRSVRHECERKITALVQAITETSGDSVQAAMQSLIVSLDMVGALERQSDASAAQANTLLSQFESARTDATAAAARAEVSLNGTSRRFWYMALFSLMGVVAAVALGLVQSRRIAKPIQNMVTYVSRLAAGDVAFDIPVRDGARKDEVGQLTRGVQELINSSRGAIHMANAMANGDYTTHIAVRSRSDQLGRALETMLNITNETLTRVSGAVNRVGDGALAVSRTSRSLSHGAQTSAAAVEEISQTVNQVDAQAQHNAEHAREANQLAVASRDAAKRGYDAVSELGVAMGEIRESGRKIASVAKLIDDIAFQTNLLALNAAVEAARAGRQGRGFSVVADEVRNLSGRSAKAAKETGEMVSAMTARMEAGAQLATRTDREFRDIVQATEQVAKLFEDISEASSAQSTAMAQIAQGLGQIDNVIQENTSNAGLTATSAQTLSLQAAELQRMVSRFRLLAASIPDNGKKFAAPPTGRELSRDGADLRLLSAPEGPRNRLSPAPPGNSPPREDV